MREAEMFVWHHALDGQEFEQTPGAGDRQACLACCSPWDCNWATELNWMEIILCFTYIKMYHFIYDIEKFDHASLLDSMYCFLASDKWAPVTTYSTHISTHAWSLQGYPTVCNPMDCSLPGSSVHGILQTRITWVECHDLLQGIFPAQGSNLCLLHCRRILYHWAIKEVPICTILSNILGRVSVASINFPDNSIETWNGIAFQSI